MNESLLTPLTANPYLSTPQLTTAGTVALARALLTAVPSAAPPSVHRFALRLRTQTEKSDDVLTRRRRESAPQDRTGELELDAATDSLWAALRDRLRTWSAFEHSGLETMEHDVLRTARARAQRARELLGRVFGSEGLSFTQRPFPEQAEHMASVLRLIEEDGLSDSLEELAGPELLAGLRHCQVHYEAMVEVRMARSDTRTTDLLTLRRGLQRAIGRYANAVLTMLDEDDPASIDTVQAALRPIQIARAGVLRNRQRAAAPTETPTEMEPTADYDVMPAAE